MTCPICAGASDADYRPFCSKRCADLDLGRWMLEQYRLAGEAADDVEDDGQNGETEG